MQNDKIVVTGGGGFVGSHVVDYLLTKDLHCSIVVLDTMTGVADRRNLDWALTTGRVEIVEGDICDYTLCCEVLREASLVINVAAESHVNYSFRNPLKFTLTNTYGAHCLVHAALSSNVTTFVHVSTDEVYGEIIDGNASEVDGLDPTTPYAASKASADMIIRSYYTTFKMDVRRIRSCNIVGSRQYPEKILPRFICQIINGTKITLHGDGSNRRNYIVIDDFCRGLDVVIKRGQPGGIYNLGSHDEFSNREIAHLICEYFQVDPEHWIFNVKDRLYNDRRYSMNTGVLNGIGWRPCTNLRNELSTIVKWYEVMFEDRNYVEAVRKSC